MVGQDRRQVSQPEQSSCEYCEKGFPSLLARGGDSTFPVNGESEFTSPHFSGAVTCAYIKRRLCFPVMYSGVAWGKMRTLKALPSKHLPRSDPGDFTLRIARSPGGE
jgi:hypothetical protein